MVKGKYMKIDRLMSITIFLLKHGRTSAAKLAEHFEVNSRTIIRDIDTLCQAGIPISSTYGVNGGYEILDTYVMDKQLVNHHDYKYIVSALKTMASAYENTKIQETIDKIEMLTKEKNAVIEMDLSVAHENTDTNEAISILEGAIEQKRVVTFWYTNNENVSHQIKVEPVGVIYKWYNWYLVGYSLEHDDYRMYKLVRMENIVVTEEKVSKEHSIEAAMKEKGDSQQITKIRAIGKACIKVKCREYLKMEIAKEYDNGDFEFYIQVPETETFWYGVFLSFGNKVKVIEPPNIIDKIKQSCQDILEIYKETEDEYIHKGTDS